MENKLTWNYLGYKEFDNPSVFYRQNDWNQTLMTKINQLSAQIHRSTLRGGAYMIKMHPRFLPLFNTLEYFNVSDDGRMTLGGRYEFILDENIEDIVLLVERNDEEFNRLEEQGLVMCIKTDGMEHYFSILKKDSYEHTLALSDPTCNVLTKDKFKGEIEILNYG